MKKLQNNYTTYEQSKRLLGLGVPSDSADCYLNSDSVIMLNGKTFQENYNEDLDLARLHLIEYPHYVPCWSVGRLIEIYCLAIGVEYIKIGISEISLIELMIKMIEIAVKVKTFDFSKLEE